MSDSREHPTTVLSEALSNWGRWGTEDELGTLNFCGPAEALRGMQCARSGEVVSCARGDRPDEVAKIQTPPRTRCFPAESPLPSPDWESRLTGLGLRFMDTR